MTATSYLSGLAALFDRVEVTGRDGAPMPLDEGVARATDLVVSLKSGGKAVLVGNGGSAAIVSHMHNDLCKAVGVRALVFNDIPLMTALANDEGYAAVFDAPVRLWMEPNDLLIAVSSSGESGNIITAATLAARNGGRLLTLTGFKPGNRLRQLGDLNIYVPAMTYGYVEMTHQIVCHCITDFAKASTV